MVGLTHHSSHRNCSNHSLHVTPFFIIIFVDCHKQLINASVVSQVFELPHILVTFDLHGLHSVLLCHQQKVLDFVDLICLDLLHHGSLWPTLTKCSNYLRPFPVSRNFSHVCKFLHLLNSNAISTFWFAFLFYEFARIWQLFKPQSFHTNSTSTPLLPPSSPPFSYSCCNNT